MKKPQTRKRKPPLERERRVCERLKEARENLRFTQAEFAAEVGIKRQRLASYEEGRAPVRFDLALRICRQFILSEKWLATGKGDPRMLMDLTSENAVLRIPADMGFGAAYDEYLGSLYDSTQAQQAEGMFRILLRPGDDLGFYRNLFVMLLDRWASMLSPQNLNKLLSHLVTIGIQLVGVCVREGEMPSLVAQEIPDIPTAKK